ncbi:MAG TPA: nucleotidyltransferase family protein, partial [Thermoplasmata archaeon]|nr:nucleotidyltransferase family protein [Thermoplasmata archaeon]
FGGDKLAAVVNGRSVIARVVARVAPLASDLVVSTTSIARARQLARHLPRDTDFRLDRSSRWGAGPGAAIAGVLEDYGNESVLFVPADIPWVETRALDRFLSHANVSSADVAAPFWGSGQTEHLVQWHRSGEIVRLLPWRRRHAPRVRRASEFLRAAPRTLLVPVGALTNRPKSFSHLTFRADLRHPSLRGQNVGSGRVRELAGAPKARYRKGVDARSAGRVHEAADAFVAEARWYDRAGLGLLAAHSLADAMDLAGSQPNVVVARRRLERALARRPTDRETVNLAG